MRRSILLLASLAAAAPLGAQTSAPARAVALQGAGGVNRGAASVTGAPGGVLIRVEATGLTPGWHGIHFHAVADCSDAAAGFKKSGGHVHGGSTPPVHGLLNPQANDSGDLTNIYAGKDGVAKAEIFSALATMDGAGGKPNLLDADGSALVIHANADDYKTQPIGGAGDRVACGVIKG